MKTINEIIKALRCSGTPRPKYDCDNCPYRRLEKVQDGIPIEEDVIIDGEKYWEGCDCEKIVIDAANLLEKIQQNMESNINFLKRKEEEAEKNAKKETDLELKGYYTGRANAFYATLALVENTQEKLNAAVKEHGQE